MGPCFQSGGADGGHPETAHGPGLHPGLQRGAQPGPSPPQEHPGQGGAEKAPALHQLTQAARCPRRLGQVRPRPPVTPDSHLQRILKMMI